ncbi:GPW/gp25 family protein [Novosphingobium rosa]|uniref:GPW/gp25 family protein n=1 Tax=Novosphingobium rosa TaxID=76978 RepID=UPI0008332121|nr:GPW/gp25 family protein [Novosphingobium rosa]
MNRDTGAALEGDDHIAQSIWDILTTPIGSRVRLEDYGSLLLQLADLPLNDVTRQLQVAACVQAIQHWEKRITLKFAKLSGDVAGGQAVFDTEWVRKGSTVSNALSRASIPLATTA